MKIYTKTGDNGTTSLVGQTRVSKAEIKVDVYGTIDELNAYLGVAVNFLENPTDKEFCMHIQHDLFKVGIVFSTDWHKFDASSHAIEEGAILCLEKEIDRLSAILEPLNDFIIPGGTPAASHVHVTRTIARRAERIAVAYYDSITLFYNAQSDIANDILQPQSSNHSNSKELLYLQYAICYLNRLSDYLFTLSRTL
ncbi:cob(I)yrinic acid a,c-diamide adenosyltransferase [Bacteroidia bacterium]|nr:cob(I)yrinic acid a,c-diamide adenosyltransferase [Bacteroidia bacterium]